MAPQNIRLSRRTQVEGCMSRLMRRELALRGPAEKHILPIEPPARLAVLPQTERQSICDLTLKTSPALRVVERARRTGSLLLRLFHTAGSPVQDLPASCAVRFLSLSSSWSAPRPSVAPTRATSPP